MNAKFIIVSEAEIRWNHKLTSINYRNSGNNRSRLSGSSFFISHFRAQSGLFLKVGQDHLSSKRKHGMDIVHSHYCSYARTLDSPMQAVTHDETVSISGVWWGGSGGRYGICMSLCGPEGKRKIKDKFGQFQARSTAFQEIIMANLNGQLLWLEHMIDCRLTPGQNPSDSCLDKNFNGNRDNGGKICICLHCYGYDRARMVGLALWFDLISSHKEQQMDLRIYMQ